MMPKPIAHSTGVFQKETTMRNRQASTKLTGNKILTCERTIKRLGGSGDEAPLVSVSSRGRFKEGTPVWIDKV